jgi:hypothetical protein
MMLLFSHDSAIGWEEVLGVALGGPVLDDLHALVEFAQAGSLPAQLIVYSGHPPL